MSKLLLDSRRRPPGHVHHQERQHCAAFLRAGQYFRVVGSVLNDGVYQYGNCSLRDETFDGAIWAMAVPTEFLHLEEEIKAWRTQYENAANSPFQSESFAGYSYTKSSTNGNSGGSVTGWQGVFASRLNKWRKL